MQSSEKWNSEYRAINAIPSSNRDEPSHALVNLVESSMLPTEANSVLDLGCGNGRNSLYLNSIGYSVQAIDYSGEALKIFNSKNTNNISIHHNDILSGLPFKTASFDIVLDSYFHCHIIDLNEWKGVLKDMHRVLKTGGTFISIQLSVNDIYYKNNMCSEIQGGHISHDPINNFKKIHYTIDRYSKLLEKDFSIEQLQILFDDTVDGKKYERNVDIYCATKK